MGSHPINGRLTTFIEKQLRREGPIGGKYITKLAQSTMRIWQVVDVHPGKWIGLLPLRDTPRPEDKVRHVYDELASESLNARDYLLGRVIPMPEGRMFAGSLLPLTRAQAGSLLGTTSYTLVHDGFVTWGTNTLRMFSDMNIGGSESLLSSRGSPINQGTEDQNSPRNERGERPAKRTTRLATSRCGATSRQGETAAAHTQAVCHVAGIRSVTT